MPLSIPDEKMPLMAPKLTLDIDTPMPEGFVDPKAYIGTTLKPPSRKRARIEKKESIVTNCISNYQDDLQSRLEWAENRIQRTAKYRGWREQKNYPWNNASNSHLPIIMTDVQRTEDTLHNAVLSTHPVMNARALGKQFEPKEQVIDNLLDYQVFIENRGEERIGNLISSFCQDGQYIAYCPYIRHKQKVTRVYPIDYPPAGVSWDQQIITALSEYYPQGIILPGKNAPWDYIVKLENPLNGKIEEFKISVFEDSGQIQAVAHVEATIFDGPALLPIELEDIVVPVRCENLQPRSPANPTGASRVTMVDYPDKDEIIRLYESGFYDEITDEKLEQIKGYTGDPKLSSGKDPEAQKLLKDDLTGLAALHSDGVTTNPAISATNTFTRLTVFCAGDLDGDGLNEEVVYWILEETQTLLRVRYLTEVYPIVPQRRPFSMAKYIPVNSQFYGIGLIELMESGYDIIKQTFDLMIDNGNIANTPFGFYRPSSGVRPETMRLGPGDLYPTNNPKEDIYFPSLPQGASVFGHNIISSVSQILDQVTLVGQLQLGGVPQGRSSALRTTSNMQALLQQGDARPERILRRFFTGLAEIWLQFHELNQIFLPKDKQFRIMRGVTQDKNPYVALTNKEQIQGRFLFDFTASILNTNRALATSSLQDMMGILISPLMLQLGITTPETAYNLVSDYIRARGQDTAKYIKAPVGVSQSDEPLLTVEEAILSIFNGYFPHGRPMEPLQVHIQKLQQFVSQPDNFKYFTDNQAKLLGQYTAMRVAEFQEAQRQQQMMIAAEQFQSQIASSGPPGAKSQSAPPNLGPGGNPSVQSGELLNETLPSAGGGGNIGGK